MKHIFKTLMRMVTLFVCSGIQLIALIFTGIGGVFTGIGKMLVRANNWTMRRLDKGKYEVVVDTISD